MDSSTLLHAAESHFLVYTNAEMYACDPVCVVRRHARECTPTYVCVSECVCVCREDVDDYASPSLIKPRHRCLISVTL